MNEILSFDNKKYMLNFNRGDIPLNIRQYFRTQNEFIYYSTKTATGFPVLEFAINTLRHITLKDSPHLIEEFSIVFDQYAKGFLEGFEAKFEPYINTPETIKESIMIAVRGNKTGFPVSYKNVKDFDQTAYFNEQAFFDMGYKYGRHYRAWLIVLETPKYFSNEDLFKSRESKPVVKIIESKMKFVNLLSEKGVKILPQLKSEYYKSKPLEFASMLNALFKLKLISINPTVYNIVELHRMVKDEFGDIGTRQSLSSNVKKSTDHAKEQLIININRIKTLI